MAEHEVDQKTAEGLVLDHLEEDPHYYSKASAGMPAMPGAPGAPVEEVKPAEKPKLSLTSTDLGAIVTVNEARAQYGFGDWPGPDGNLSLAAFKVKHATAVAGSAQTDKGQDPSKPVPAAATPAFGAKPGAAKPPPFGKKPEEEIAPEVGDPKVKKPPFAK
jgi:hypothetical protein